MVFDKTGKPDHNIKTNPVSQETEAIAKRELLKFGEGQIAYFRPVNAPTPDGEGRIEGIGVFSATGELIAVCEDMTSAVGFAMENDLKLVARH